MAYGSQTPPLPFSKADHEHWSSEITRADRLREDKLTAWDVPNNLKRYAPDGTKSEQVNDGSDFADSERKKAGLFYDTPFVTIKPDPEGDASIALLHQELVNTVLDEPMMNAKATALKAIQACTIAIQPSPTKIGYVPTIVEVDQPDANDPTGQATIKMPVVVHEEFFWSKLSERSLLLPKELRDTDYDRVSPWLGYKFRMPTSQLRREYHLPADLVIPASNSGEHKLYFTDDEMAPEDSANDPWVTGTYIEYKAALRDPKVSHPKLIRCLVLVDGLEQPIKHEDASWQIDPVTKQFNPRSGFEGFSIHPLALRDLPDSAWVPADSTMTAELTCEISDYLTDIKRQRESNRLIVAYDSAAIDTDAAEKIKDGKAPAFIPLKAGAMAQGLDSIIKQVANIGSGREHYDGLEIFQQKREKILGISSNTVGGQDDSNKTATEISEVTRNTEARFEQERQRSVGGWYLSGVRKVSALLVRYGDKLALEILGQERGQRWIQARDQGALSRFAFSVQIDGGKYMDVEADRRSHVALYNLTAQDPNTNRVPLLKKMAPLWGMDPAEWVVDQLPEPKPEPPKITLSFSHEAFNPSLPQFAIICKIARQGGLDISDQDVLLAQQQAQSLAMYARNVSTGESADDPIEAATNQGPMPVSGAAPQKPPPQPGQQAHGGAAVPAPRIDQHQLDQTGKLPGAGAVM